jgi:hypothetical protein
VAAAALAVAQVVDPVARVADHLDKPVTVVQEHNRAAVHKVQVAVEQELSVITVAHFKVLTVYLAAAADIMVAHQVETTVHMPRVLVEDQDTLMVHM